MKFKLIAVSFIALAIFNTLVKAQPLNGDIGEQFYEYSNTLQEKVYVHTDKNAYLPGEIMWFTAYTLEASTNHRIAASKVTYVEIIDSQNRPILQAKIEMRDGIGAGSFYLPVSFNSGNYTFRAYTNWMKNFSPEMFFHKTISVYNTYKNEQIVSEKKADGAKIQFFPEGGNLVSGLNSKVAFRVIDRNGIGARFQGAVIDQHNDTIVRFQPHKFGIGSFSFLPTKGIKYQAIIKPENDKSFIVSLPDVYPNGYVINFERKDARLNVASTFTGEETLLVFVHSGHRVILNQTIAMKNGLGGLNLPKEQMVEGITHITLFDKNLNPLCERLYFNKPDRVLNIAAEITKKEYSKRENISLDIFNSNEIGQPIAANFSMSVYLSDSIDRDSDDISAFAWLTSNLKGTVENPEFYLTTKDDEASDNLMLSHGWSRFSWTDLKNFNPNISHLPELDGHIVNAKISNAQTKTVSSTNIAYLSVPGKALQFYTSSLRNNGEFKFFTKNFYGSNEIVLQTDPRTDSLLKLEIVSPFSDKFGMYNTPKFIFAKDFQQSLLKRSVSTQVTNVFMGKFLKKEIIAQEDSIPFFFNADKTYKLDDYVRFPAMEEVLREYVSEMGVDIKKKAYHLKILDPVAKQYYTSSPLILLDGVPMFDDGNKIIKYDPLKVEKLNIVNTTFFYGPTVFKVIASFQTYKGDFSGLEINPLATVADYDGLQLQREFYSPMYSDDKLKSSRIPDFRNTLYWSPNIKTDKEGKAILNFSSSDLSGKYKIVIQGVSEGGRLGSKTLIFDIKE